MTDKKDKQDIYEMEEKDCLNIWEDKPHSQDKQIREINKINK